MAEKPDGRYSRTVVEVDRTTESDAATVRHFRDGTLGITFGKGFAVAVLLAFLGWYATHSGKPESAAPQCLTKEQFDESMRTRDEQVARRFDSLETDMSYVKVTVRLVQDRLPPQK